LCPFGTCLWWMWTFPGSTGTVPIWIAGGTTPQTAASPADRSSWVCMSSATAWNQAPVHSSRAAPSGAEASRPWVRHHQLGFPLRFFTSHRMSHGPVPFFVSGMLWMQCFCFSMGASRRGTRGSE
jgi:hypothetical protein